jgi:hypothetical protein
MALCCRMSRADSISGCPALVMESGQLRVIIEARAENANGATNHAPIRLAVIDRFTGHRGQDRRSVADRIHFPGGAIRIGCPHRPGLSHPRLHHVGVVYTAVGYPGSLATLALPCSAGGDENLAGRIGSGVIALARGLAGRREQTMSAHGLRLMFLPVQPCSTVDTIVRG